MDSRESHLLESIDQRTRHTDELVKDIRQSMRDEFVSKAEFGPVKLIAYGIVGGAMLAVLIALMNTILAR